MANGSVVVAVRDGGLRRFDVGRFELLVAAATALDVVTTTDILLAERGEANVIVSWLAAIDVWLAVAGFAGLAGFTVLLSWLDLGWVSVAVGASAILIYGSGGVHNVVLRATGWAPKTALPLALPIQIHVVEPVLGAVLGVAVAYYWYGGLPWREVGAYGALTAADVAVVVLFW